MANAMHHNPKTTPISMTSASPKLLGIAKKKRIFKVQNTAFIIVSVFIDAIIIKNSKLK